MCCLCTMLQQKVKDDKFDHSALLFVFHWICRLKDDQNWYSEDTDGMVPGCLYPLEEWVKRLGSAPHLFSYTKRHGFVIGKPSIRRCIRTEPVCCPKNSTSCSLMLVDLKWWSVVPEVGCIQDNLLINLKIFNNGGCFIFVTLLKHLFSAWFIMYIMLVQ